MHIRKLLVIAAICGIASGCQTAPETRAPAGGEEAIAVRGFVEIYPGGHGLGLIRAEDGRCYDLALPREVLRNSERWNRKIVDVSGGLEFRPDLKMPEIMWFDIRDRKVEGFGCSEDIIYVHTIRRVKG